MSFKGVFSEFVNIMVGNPACQLSFSILTSKNADSISVRATKMESKTDASADSTDEELMAENTFDDPPHLGNYL